MNNYGKKAEENLFELNKNNEKKRKMLLRSGVIIVFLVLILIIMGLYKYIVKISKDNLNNTLSNNEEIYQIVSAVEEAGFTLEIKEDGSYVLHEKSEK